MIISSKIASCFPKINFEEKDLDVVKKIMNNSQIDSRFKSNFGHTASKFFHEIDLKASVELGR